MTWYRTRETNTEARLVWELGHHFLLNNPHSLHLLCTAFRSNVKICFFPGLAFTIHQGWISPKLQTLKIFSCFGSFLGEVIRTLFLKFLAKLQFLVRIYINLQLSLLKLKYFTELRLGSWLILASQIYLYCLFSDFLHFSLVSEGNQFNLRFGNFEFWRIFIFFFLLILINFSNFISNFPNCSIRKVEGQIKGGEEHINRAVFCFDKESEDKGDARVTCHVS